MGNKNVFFSVVITAYNAEKYIWETLESVYSQTFCQYEVIIVDDKSTDDTVVVIDKFIKNKPNWCLIRNDENRGVSESRNTGFKQALGQYISILDSDDIWESDKLQIQYDYIQKYRPDVCYSAYSFISEQGELYNYIYNVSETINYKSLLRQNYVGCSTVVLRRDITEKYRMLSEFSHEDYVLWLTLIKNNYTFRGIDKPLVKYRIRSTSRSYKKTKAARERFKIYRLNEKLSLIKSMYYFCCYMFNGFKKSMMLKLREMS